MDNEQPKDPTTQQDAIFERGLEIANKQAIAMRSECDGTYVGAEENHYFDHDGKMYEVSVTAFWGKAHHFDIFVESVDGKYSKSQNCVDF